MISGFQCRKKNTQLITILTIKIVDISVNKFLLMMKVLPMCFFSFSLLEEANLNVIICSGSSWFELFFRFLGSLIDLSRFLEYILGILDQNKFLTRKNQGLVF